MKTEQFKELVRAIVKEELKKTLPALVPKIVAEALNNKSSKSQLVEEEDFFAQLQKEISGNVVPADSKPKQPKKYSNNPLLNDILNETTVRIPNESEMSSMVNSTPSILDNTENLPEVVSSALTKNYSSLLKAVDKKVKEKR